MTQSYAAPDPALSYATPAAKTPRVWPAATILLAALGMIALGGCFLIGVMVINMPDLIMSPLAAKAATKTAGLYVLEAFLYVISVGCFAMAGWLITVGVRWMRKLAFS